MEEKRLINAKSFAEHLERMARTAYPNLFPGLLEAAEYAKDFPTVDAVEVVRCRDCKHWHFETGLCNLHSNFSKSVLHFFDEYDFCSYGERKDGDGNG